MKKYSTLFFTVLFCTPCLSQVEWVSDFEKPRTLETFKVSVQDHHLLHFETAGFGEPPEVIALDGQGDKVFQLTDNTPPSPLGSLYDIIELKDSSLLLSNVENSISATSKFDKNWTYAGTELFYFFFPPGNIFGKGLSDNGYILYTKGDIQVVRAGADGEEVWNTVFSGFPINDLAITSSDRLVFTGTEGLAIMDIDANLDTIYAELPFEEIQVTSYDGVVGQNQNILTALSSEFEPMGSHGFSIENILDYSVGQGRVAVLAGNRFVYLFSDSLALLDSFELVDESGFRLIDITSSGLALAGTETYGSTMPTGGTTAHFSKDYSFAGDGFGLSNDIGVIDIQLGMPTGVVALPDYHEIFYGNAEVTVENFGTNTVDGFYVRFENQLQDFSQTFGGISLQPSATITLPLDSFWIRTDLGVGETGEICMWTSHPDRRLDANSTNDGFCTDFLVSNSEIISNTVFSVYPNPSRDGSTASYGVSGQGELEVRVFNSVGMQVYHNALTGNAGSISLPRHSAGLYHITLVENGRIVKTVNHVQLE